MLFREPVTPDIDATKSHERYKKNLLTVKKQPTKCRRNCSRTTSGSSNQLQPARRGGGGGEVRRSLNGTTKFSNGLQITTLEVNKYHYQDLK